MSDFHSSRFADHGELIAQKVREFAPELILVTGDMADCSKDRSAKYFFSVADRLAGKIEEKTKPKARKKTDTKEKEEAAAKKTAESPAKKTVKPVKTAKTSKTGKTTKKQSKKT